MINTSLPKNVVEYWRNIFDYDDDYFVGNS